MHWLDATILLTFIVYAIYAGFSSRKQASQSLEEYFLAGRSLSGWRAGFSMAATQFAADTPLNVMGIIAVSGIFYLWQMWIYALAFLLMGFVLATCWRRAKILTDAELTEVRYGARPAAVLRGFKALYFGTLFNCIVLGWVLFAGAKIAEPFLHWHEWLPGGLFSTVVTAVTWVGVPFASVGVGHPEVWVLTASNAISIFLILVVTALYSTTGGLRSVVKTDMAQLAIMLVATLFFAVIVVSRLGGLGELQDMIRERFAGGAPGPIMPGEILAFTPGNAKDVTLSVMVLFGLQWLIQLNADGTGYLAQRSMACRSERDAKIAAIVFSVTQILLRSLLWIPIGLGLLLLFPPETSPETLQLSGEALSDYTLARELTYVRGIAELMPVGVVGLLLTAMLAALALTVDTHLNWGSSYWTNDIYKRFICRHFLRREPSPRSLVWVARMSNLLLVLIALWVMTRLENINETWQVSLMLGAGMGLPLILRWIWWRMNAWGEIAALVASFVLAWLFVREGLLEGEPALRLLVMAFVSGAATFAAIWLKGPEDRSGLEAFYRRVQPPGFWGPIAKGCGDDPREIQARLYRGLSAMLVSAFSIFSVLVGLGSAIAGSPSPPWWPGGRILWMVVVTLFGLILVPIWWRLGFGERRRHAPDVSTKTDQ